MAPNSTSHTPPQEADRAQALAEEVRELRRLLLGLQDELRPALQSQLRERSDELQRLGGELSVQQAEVERLSAELARSTARAEALEDETRRWKDAARRGLDEIAEKARAAAERFEARTAELAAELAAARAQLQASRAQADAIALARDAALHDLARRNARVRALKAKVIRREVRRIELMNTLSWRLTAPIRWLPQAFRRALLEGARLRRRLLKKTR